MATTPSMARTICRIRPRAPPMAEHVAGTSPKENRFRRHAVHPAGKRLQVGFRSRHRSPSRPLNGEHRPPPASVAIRLSFGPLPFGQTLSRFATYLRRSRPAKFADRSSLPPAWPILRPSHMCLFPCLSSSSDESPGDWGRLCGARHCGQDVPGSARAVTAGPVALAAHHDFRQPTRDPCGRPGWIRRPWARLSAGRNALRLPNPSAARTDWALADELRQLRLSLGPSASGEGRGRRAFVRCACDAGCRRHPTPVGPALKSRSTNPLHSRAGRRGGSPRRTSVFAWIAIWLGLTTFVCGVALLAWSISTTGPSCGRVGMPITLAGQFGLLLGLVLQLDRLRHDNSQTVQNWATSTHDWRSSSKRPRCWAQAAARHPTRSMPTWPRAPARNFCWPISRGNSTWWLCGSLAAARAQVNAGPDELTCASSGRGLTALLTSRARSSRRT